MKEQLAQGPKPTNINIKRRQSMNPALQEQHKQTQIIPCWKQFQTSLNSKYFDYLIISLVIVYTLLIFIYFALDNKDNANNDDIQSTLHIVQLIEMAILAIFALEIILKLWAFHIKEYFKDIWYIFDAVIIFISIILLAVDLSVEDQNFQTISKILRGIFRFLRLFLVFRKVTQFKKIQTNHLIQQTKTPVERLLEIFRKLKDNVDENEYIVTFDWSIEIISNNELYKPMFQKEDKEAAKWTSNFDQNVSKKSSTKKITEKNKETNTSELVTKDENKQQEKIPLPAHVQSYFYEKSNIELIDFDIFGFHGLNKGNELGWLLIYLFQYKFDICQELQINPKKLFDFINVISLGYIDQNPYHNRIHAFDVTSTVNFFLSACNFIEIGKVSKFDLSYMYIGAACHDYEHPGVNNMFLINTKSPLAVRYNDKSPLENHHVSASFFMIRKEEYEILQNFTKSDYKLWRERMITMILATDMSVHFADLAKLKGRLASDEFDPKVKDKALCLDSILHASDISNPFKPFQLYQPWAKRVLEEFWNQGDQEREKGLSISYLCDRFTVNTAKSQLGFIDFIVKPFYETIAKYMPMVQNMLSIFEENKEKWKEQIDFYDAELDRINAEEEAKQAAQIQILK